MNQEEFFRYIENSTGNESNICQICVIRDGGTRYQECWHGFQAGDAMNINSVTKGVMALLTGIALEKGYLDSVDRKVLDYFPDYPVKRGEKTIYEVKIRHLLTMTAPYKFRSEPWKRVCTSEDWTLTVLDFLGGRKGLTGEFQYATLGIQILAGILERASGKKLISLANEELFVPIGIPEVTIHGPSDKDDQFDFLMNKKPRKHEWFSDPQDTVTAGWGLCLSARDLALLGNLLLQDGVAEGRRLISEEYLKEMTSPHLKLGERFGNMSYGYLWYRPYEDREVCAAIGDAGNIIYVDPKERISVGITGYFKPRIFDRVDFIEKVVLPAVL